MSPMSPMSWPRATLALLLCGAAAASPASERSRERLAQLVQLGGVLQQAAGEAAQRDDPTRYRDIVIGGTVHGAAQGCANAAIEAVLRQERGAGVRRACKDGAATQAAAGAVDARFVALTEEANQRRISTLRVAAEQVQRDNLQLQGLVEAAGLSLRDGQARLAGLQRDVAARRVSVGDAAQARQQEQRQIDQLRASIEQLKASRRRHGDTARLATGSAVERQTLDGQIARMDRQIATLERQLLDYQRALLVSGA